MIGVLLALPRRLLGALDDLHTVAVELADIRQHTGSMQDEVARMRRGVDSLGAQVDDLRGDVERIRVPRRRIVNGRVESRSPVELSE